MNKKNGLSSAMDSHHKRIDKLLDSFESRYLKNNCLLDKMTEGIFLEFKWELEKHMFMEEKAILSFFSSEDQDLFTVARDIEQDHIKILRLLSDVEGEIKNKKTVNLKNLRMVIRKHNNFEDSQLYEKLDDILSDKQKKELVRKVKEVIKTLKR